MKKKIAFILPPILLTAATWIWLYYKPGRYYGLKNEFLYLPLLLLHFIQQFFYFVSMIVTIVRQINKNTRSSSNLYYMIAAIIIWLYGLIGTLGFLVITSGV